MCLISCCIRCSDRGHDTINTLCGMVEYVFTPVQLLCWKTEFSMHCGYLHCRNPKVSCTHLSNCSTGIDGSFLTYATLPVVKASRVIISNQYTLVWSASINVLYMLQLFAFIYTLHYITWPTHAYRNLSSFFFDMFTMKSCKTVPVTFNTPDCFSVHLSACSSWQTAECVFMKFDIVMCS